MVFTTKLIKDLKYSYEGVFDFKELTVVIKKYLKDYGYDIEETLYNKTGKGDAKNLKMKWQADQKVDDYNKCIIKIEIDLNDYKEGYVSARKIADGKFNLTINAEIERDYDAKFRKKTGRIFLRGLYERFVTEAKQSKVDNNLKNVVDGLKKEVKNYLEEN
jgi:hypothetical protein